MNKGKYKEFKLKKVEKRKEKGELDDLRLKIDNNFGELSSLLKDNNLKDIPLKRNNVEEYDDFVELANGLSQESKALSTYRSLTEQEKAKLERDNLLRLANEEQKRLEHVDDEIEEEEEEEMNVQDSEDEESNEEDHFSDDFNSEFELGQSEDEVESEVDEENSERQYFDMKHIEVPSTLEELNSKCDLMNYFEEEEHMEQLFILTDPRIGKKELEQSKELLDILFQRIDTLLLPSKDELSEIKVRMEKVARITPVIFKFVAALPRTAFNLTLKRLRKIEAKTVFSAYPLLFFNFLFSIFPVTDLKHPIITPILLMLSKYLYEFIPKTTRDFSRYVFAIGLFVRACISQKKYSPEIIFATNRVFRILRPKNFNLNNVENNGSKLNLKWLYVAPKKVDNLETIVCQNLLKTVFPYIMNFKMNAAFPQMTKQIFEMLPDCEEKEKMREFINHIESTRQGLRAQCFKPKPLEMKEPKFDHEYRENTMLDTEENREKAIKKAIKKEKKIIEKEVKDAAEAERREREMKISKNRRTFDKMMKHNMSSLEVEKREGKLLEKLKSKK
eukprot:TRINITY_DN3078_c5_g6_i3.p1 TRINITY_DN3078_c5_g6~~TRINITY_DN3078_c5_g6_i3.p1  ORF type:complete len:560 (-),score=200.61 TRINITY_DN3078_c5_g6_i3:56-1735(-)